MTYVIFGGSRGIGAEIATICERKRISNIIVSRNKPHIDANCAHIAYNLSDIENLDILIDEIKKRVDKKITAFIYCAAATTIYGDNANTNKAREMMNVNLLTPTLLTQEISRYMENNGNGSITYISSIAAHVGIKGNPAYAATKAGLHGLTKAYAVELEDKKIRVNSVSPGYTKTEMTEASYKDIDRRDQIRNRTLLGRWANAKEIAEVVYFLTSKKAAYINGVDIVVDGGILAKGL